MDRYSFGNLTHIPIFHYHENMKTTVDLSDNLVREVKNSASSRGSTFREIVESALRSYIQAQHRERGGYTFKPHTFRGEGVQEGISEERGG